MEIKDVTHTHTHTHKMEYYSAIKKRVKFGEFTGGPLVRTQHFHC